MEGLIQDPVPVYLAIIFFFVLSAAGIGIASSYNLMAERKIIDKKLGKKNIDDIISGKL